MNCALRLRKVLVVLAIALMGAPTPAGGGRLTACPFCSAVARTLTEQMNDFDIVAIAVMKTKPHSPDERELPRASFSIVDCLRGKEYCMSAEGDAPFTFETIVVGNSYEIGERFLVMGNGTRMINWTTPLPVTNRVVDYMKQLEALPEKGADRLAFVAKFFEDDETLLAGDAYDEYAKASYEDVKDVAPRLDRAQLVRHLKNPDVMAARKRLYYTLLGLCGNDEDIKFLEEVICSGDPEQLKALDALVASWLNLTGDDGVKLIEEQFLGNPDADSMHFFSVITALRFHATETDRLSKERILQALRLVLDRPKIADTVINDLARMEDWSVMERLVAMFREANTDETRWIRVPVISYLQACPLPAAAKHLEELREIDPQAIKQAEMLAELDWEDIEEDDWGDEDGDTSETSDSQPAVPAANDSSDDDAGDGVEDGDRDGDGEKLAGVSTVFTDSVVFIRPASRGPQTIPQVEGSGASLVSTRGSATQVQSLPTATLGRVADSTAAPHRGESTGAQAMVAGMSNTVLLGAVAAVCLLLFALSWSVLNGWFEKLLF